MLVEASAAGRPGAIPEAVLFGILLGLLYDGFRIVRVSLGLKTVGRGRKRRILPKHFIARKEKMRTGRGIPGGVLLFLLDILYSLTAGVLASVFFYWRNDGILRWYLLFSAAVGFAAEYFTVGACLMRAADLVLGIIYDIAAFVYNHTLYPVFRLCYGIFCFLIRTGKRFVLRLSAAAGRIRQYSLEKRSLVLKKQTEKRAADFVLAAFTGQTERTLPMAKKKKKAAEPKKKVGFFTRVAFFVFIGFCGVTIFQMATQVNSRKKEIAAAEKQIALYEAQIELLEDELATPFDNTSVRKIARSKLNYSMPDDIVFYNDLSN